MKKLISNILLCVFTATLLLQTAVFASASNLSVRQATYYDSGALKSLTVSFSWHTASANCRLVLMSQKLSETGGTNGYGDFTNFGTYGNRFTDFDAVLSYDQTGGTQGTFGIIAHSDESAISRTDLNTMTINFPSTTLSTKIDKLYYIYLWTKWGGYVYPDALICAIGIKDGAVSYAVATGTNSYDEDAFSSVGSKEKYSITINKGDHMTRQSSGGAESQSNLTAAMTPVVYTADSGYYFPDSYSVATVNGISVRRDSESQITVYGTPSQNAEITLTAATLRPSKQAPTADDFDFQAPSSLTYDGNEKTANVNPKTDVSGMGTVKVKYFDGSGNLLSSAPTNAGTYTVKIDVSDGTNYTSASDLTKSDWTFTIEKATIDSVSLDVTAPVALDDKQTSVTAGTGYSAAIVWDTPESTFDFNTAYTATVTLTADENHNFADTLDLSAGGWSKSGSNGVLTFKKTFAKTDKAILTYLVIEPAGITLKNYHETAASAATELLQTVGYQKGTPGTAGSGVVYADIEWSCSDYDPALGASNTFTWTVKSGELSNYTVASSATTSDSVTVNNASALPTSSSGHSVSRYTVKFNTSGGKTIANQTVAKNNKATEPKNPTRDGYVFDGWYTSADFTTEYDFDTKVTKSITLYAKWLEDEAEAPSDEKAAEQNPTEGDEQGSTENVWKNPFADINESDWFFDFVKYANENGLMSGATSTAFAPNESLTRAMLTAVLWRAAGKPAANFAMPFKDIGDAAYYTEALRWAASENIVTGVTPTTFSPDESITREQIASIIYRFAKAMGYDVSVGESTNILSYADFDEISEYAIEALQYAVGSGLMNGKTENTLNPKDTATRAEIAAILSRFIEGNK